LTTAATLERGYLALRRSGTQAQVNEMDKRHRQWLADLASFKSALQAQGVDPKAVAYMNEAFERLAERIKKLTA
jgi:hypothetical protein